jgi:uncharacterized oxidoreductase
MMESEKLAKAFAKGLISNNYEITPGPASQLRMMRRIAPRFIFKMINKQMS